MIYETNPKEVGKILQRLQKQDKTLEKYDRKGNLTKYVSTCLEQAQACFKIYRKEQCIEKLNQAMAYCHEHPNAFLPGNYPFELISNSNALGAEIDKLYDFYFGVYNKIQELHSQGVQYWSHCAFSETKEDVKRKSGTIIPIPFIATISKSRFYSGVFSHAGWVFSTHKGLAFLLLPSQIVLNSPGPLNHWLDFYCMVPQLTEFTLRWSEIENAYLVDHVYPHNKTVRIQALQTNFDVVVHSHPPLFILNQTIGNHKELGIDNLIFRPSYASNVSLVNSKKGLQKQFMETINSMKSRR